MVLSIIAKAFIAKKVISSIKKKNQGSQSDSAALITAAKSNVASRKAENSNVTEMKKEIEKLKEENEKMAKQQQTAQNYVIAPPPRHYGRPPVSRGHHRPAPQPQHNPFSSGQSSFNRMV